MTFQKVIKNYMSIQAGNDFGVDSTAFYTTSATGLRVIQAKNYERHRSALSILTTILIRYSGYALESVPSQSRAQIQAQLCRALARQEKLNIVLPAFPYKSINRMDKVAGPDPDAGEYAALKTLSSL